MKWKLRWNRRVKWAYDYLLLTLKLYLYQTITCHRSAKVFYLGLWVSTRYLTLSENIRFHALTASDQEQKRNGFQSIHCMTVLKIILKLTQRWDKVSLKLHQLHIKVIGSRKLGKQHYISMNRSDRSTTVYNIPSRT